MTRITVMVLHLSAGQMDASTIISDIASFIFCENIDANDSENTEGNSIIFSWEARERTL